MSRRRGRSGQRQHRGPEQRGQARAKASHAVDVFDVDGVTLMATGRLLNMTEFGACLELSASLKEGRGPFMRLELDSHRLVTLPIEILWAKPRRDAWEHGVRFGEIPEIIRMLLRKESGMPAPGGETTTEAPETGGNDGGNAQ